MVEDFLINKWPCCNIREKIFIFWVRRYTVFWRVNYSGHWLYIAADCGYPCTFFVRVNYINSSPSTFWFFQILRLQECLSKYERADDGSAPQVIMALNKLFYLFSYNTGTYPSLPHRKDFYTHSFTHTQLYPSIPGFDLATSLLGGASDAIKPLWGFGYFLFYLFISIWISKML